MSELSRGQILKNPEVLGVGTTGASIRLLDADENSYIDLKVPDTVGTAYTFTLPDSGGTINQVLQTDGTGATDWASIDLTPSGTTGQIQYNNADAFAGAAITTDGNDLYLTGPGAGSTAYVRFENGAGTANIAIGASTVTANSSYLLPDTVGNVGQVLKINGKPDANTATLAWQNDETGASGSSASGGSGDVQFSDGAGNFTSDVDLNFDATIPRLNIGDDTDAQGNLFIQGTVFGPLAIRITESGANRGPITNIIRESTSPAADDFIGAIDYRGAYNAGPPTGIQQDYGYSLMIGRIEDPEEDSTTFGSVGPWGSWNIYHSVKDNGTLNTAFRAFQTTPNGCIINANWPLSNFGYNGLTVDVTTSEGGGTNNVTPASSALLNLNYQGNPVFQVSPFGTAVGNGMSLLDADGSNFTALRAAETITSDYTIRFPPAGGAANDILQFDASQNASFVSNTRTLNFVIDGGGSAITTGKKGVIVVDGDYTVTGWSIIADQSGSIVVDVNRSTFANFPTTSSIAGTELPTLSSAQKAEDLTLSTWTTSISARDVIEFEVDSATTVTRVTVALRLVPA